MICPACGATNRESARFCRSCGRPFDELEREEAVDVGAAEVPGAEGPPEIAPGEEPGPAAEPTAEMAQEPVAVEEPAPDAMPGEEPVLPSAGEPPAGIELPGDVAEAPEVEREVDLAAPASPDTAAAGLAPDAPEEDPPESALEPAPGDEVGPAPESVSEPEEDLEIDEDDALGAFWREDEEPIEPASPGALIAGRYLLLEVLDAGEAEVLYLARDLQRCWQCGAEVDAGEAFCPECGAAQEQPSASGPETRLLEVRPPGDELRPEVDVVSRLEHEGRVFLVLAAPQVELEPEHAAVPPASEIIRLIVGQRSDPGQVRDLNEDSVLVIQMAPTYQSVTSPVLGLFSVADGMGGHDGGEIASKLALQVLADHTLRTILLPELAGELRLDEDVLAHLRQAALAANDAVYLARQKRGNDMGTTLTTMLVRDRLLFLAHVGDCRAYRWSGAGLEQLTTDHSVVASMIAHGQVSPDEIYTHPHRSVIYRCVGDQPTVEVDGDMLPLEPGHRIIVCSDGLWEMVRSEGIADVMMQEANPQVACDLLVRRANAAGGEDNISVVIVQVEVA